MSTRGVVSVAIACLAAWSVGWITLRGWRRDHSGSPADRLAESSPAADSGGGPRGIVTRDPRRAAADSVATMPPGSARFDRLGELMAEWGAADFRGALQWAQGLPAGPLQQTALLHLSHRWQQIDLRGAIAYAATLPESNDQLIRRLLEQWVSREPQAAAAWLAGEPDGPRKRQLATVVLALWAREAPDLAAQYVDSMSAGEPQAQAAAAVASIWSGKDPAAVARWAAQLPEGRTRLYSIEIVAARWSRDNPAAAAEWLGALAPGPELDTAASAMASAVMTTRPELAAQLAGGIGDPELRHRQIDRSVRRWIEIDRDAALRWLDGCELPLYWKESIARDTAAAAPER